VESFDLIVIPDNEEEGSAEICVEASIQDRQYTFLLDTGAAITRVPWDEFTSEFPVKGIHESSSVLGDLQYERITIPDFRLGSIVVGSFNVTRIPAGDAQTRGLIGMDLLQNFPCSFLFDENRVVLEPVVSDRLNDLILDDRQHPYITASAAGNSVQAVWDTGTSLTCVDLGFIQENRRAFEDAGESQGSDSSGNTVTTPIYLMKDFSCDGYLFPGHKVVGLDLSFVNSRIKHPMTMILGYNTLYMANWVFDFPARRWGIICMLDA